MNNSFGATFTMQTPFKHNDENRSTLLRDALNSLWAVRKSGAEKDYIIACENTINSYIEKLKAMSLDRAIVAWPTLVLPENPSNVPAPAGHDIASAGA